MIAIDWGTSSFRAYRLAPGGAIIERREAPLGILKIEQHAFAQALHSQVADWVANGESLVLMSGMIGSRQGWREAPYVRCPGGADELARGLVDVELVTGGPAWIVAGMMTQDANGIHDVMRGEETQLIGAMSTLGIGTHTVCLPGTHSKWVEVKDQRVAAFRTHMTGEVFAVLSDHSILGRTFTDASSTDWNAFDRGVLRSQDSGGLLHHLFGVRAQTLAGALAQTEGRDYLSGLLIGAECVAEIAIRKLGMIHVLGAKHMSQRYARALSHFGIESRALDADAVVGGLYRIARARFSADLGRS